MALIQIQPTENSPTMLKSALVKFSGGIREPEEILVGPGTTPADLLKHLGLNKDDYAISWRSPSMFLSHNELLYPKIENGDLLYVSSKIDAGK